MSQRDICTHTYTCMCRNIQVHYRYMYVCTHTYTHVCRYMQVPIMRNQCVSTCREAFPFTLFFLEDQGISAYHVMYLDCTTRLVRFLSTWHSGDRIAGVAHGCVGWLCALLAGVVQGCTGSVSPP